MLNELDKELESRGHRFVRYADDVIVLCKSERSAERTMKNLVSYTREKLFLKVNREKSAVAYITKVKFLGYSFYTKKGEGRLRIHLKSVARMRSRIKEITSRSNGWGNLKRKEKLSQFIRGWVNYFKLADMKSLLMETDEWYRRRLRMVLWKQWKRISTKQANLMKLGVNKQKAWEYANTRKSYWHIAKSWILSKTVTNERLRKAGYVFLTDCYLDARKSIKEPPYTERYVRWCERTGRELIPTFLLDRHSLSHINRRRLIDKSKLSIATMTFARSAEEDMLLRESLAILASYGVPVYITDGGSPPDFLDFLRRFPEFILSDATAKGLVPQVANSLKNAVKGGSEYVLYAEPDKKYFFRMLDGFLHEASMDKHTGIFLASRTKEGLNSYAAFQQMTETCINNCCSELTGFDLDFTYGPFLLQPSLVPFLELVSNDLDWGWRTFIFGMASRLKLTLKEFKEAYLCPPGQKEDNPAERIYRIRQCEQSLRGVVFAKALKLPNE